MITGEQLSEIMRTLGWSLAELAARSEIQADTIEAAATSVGPVSLASSEEERLRTILGQEGVMVLEPRGYDLGIRILARRAEPRRRPM